ncbi:MAG: DMT family transporter [Alphaproteobacteria bacterium]
MGVREWLMLVALALVWGGSFFCNELALTTLPPLTVVLGRVGLAAIVLTAIVYGRGERLPTDAATWGLLLVMGLLNNVTPFGLIVWGQSRIDSGLASILNATTPLATVLLAHWLTADEKLTRGKVAGVVFGLAGVAVLIGPAALSDIGQDLAGQLAVLAAAVSYALAGIHGRRLRRLPPLTAAAGMLIGATVLLVPAVALLEPNAWRNFDAVSLAGVVGLALPCTALAYGLYFAILRAAGATNLLLVTFLIPVSAILLGAGVLGERLEPTAFAGMAFIALGLAAVDGRLAAWLGGACRSAWRAQRSGRGRRAGA